MEDWLAISSKAGKQEYKDWLAKKNLIDNSIAAEAVEDLNAIADWPCWYWTSTTATALSVSPTEAAILPKGFSAHDQIPRVSGWKKILKDIGWGKNRAFIADFLHDIEFQHHQSTNGRLNIGIARWERHGVRSVAGWMRAGQHQHHNLETPAAVSPRTFHRIKDALIELGLIDAEKHLWLGKQHLWIKPTEELSRILFVPGYWVSVKAKYQDADAKEAPPPKGKGKPRGISAVHAKLDAELRALYLSVIRYELPALSKNESWAIWDRLTKPVAIGKKYTKAPFTEKGSYRYRKIYDSLGLNQF